MVGPKRREKMPVRNGAKGMKMKANRERQKAKQSRRCKKKTVPDERLSVFKLRFGVTRHGCRARYKSNCHYIQAKCRWMFTRASTRVLVDLDSRYTVQTL